MTEDEMNLILQEREMREEFVNVYNKWIEQMPAFIIAPILTRLANNAEQAKEIQYQKALEKESEDENNGKTNNSTT